MTVHWSLNTPRGTYPPVTLAEIYCENKHLLTKIRRLHLIVVDEKTRSVSKRVYQDFKDCQIPADLAGCLNTLSVPIPKWDCPFRVGFVFARWTILTGRVTCYGHAEETVGISGWLIRSLAASLILLQHFFLLRGCDGSRGYWQSLTKRELNKQHQWYCVPEESQVSISL